MKLIYGVVFPFILILLTSLSGNAQTTGQFTHLPFENSTPGNESTPIIMPYNRLIDPAGHTVFFGDPDVENHSLDAFLVPDGKSLLVEDRYGIVIFNLQTHKQVARYSFLSDDKYKTLMSSFSGIKAASINGVVNIFWSAASGRTPDSYVMQAEWDGSKIKITGAIPFKSQSPARLALPNEVVIRQENGDWYLYVVLNGNNQLQKIRITDQKLIWSTTTGVAPYGLTISGNFVYVTNWGGPVPTDTVHYETAGVPWGSAYIEPRTGAIARGTVAVIDMQSGKSLPEISVGLHPNAIIHSKDEKFIFVANGNSDNISLIRTSDNAVIDSISINLSSSSNKYIGTSPNALAIDNSGQKLYVANGMQNAIAVMDLDFKISGIVHHTLKGFIPTGAYPSSIVCTNNSLIVTNLEAAGSRVNSMSLPQERIQYLPKLKTGAYTPHKELASVSFIPLPSQQQLDVYSKKVETLNLVFREQLSGQLPRKNIQPKPVPERIGEPSVFKHVLYIIKENRTYDQVFGDIAEGRGSAPLCIFGDSITPNQHQLVKDFSLLDNYYVSGKSSAEGHQWTDAGMVTDYIEKNVRAWFRSYPHAQYDAMVYDKEGFIWNNALDHGKSVRIYGEACTTQFDQKLDWAQIYEKYLTHQPFDCKNITTISRVRPILSQNYPGYDDPRVNDQLRADAFINELKEYEGKPGDEWPQLMIMALPNDHTAGLSPGYPVPRAMVADNDLALGRIIEAVTKSRFWDSTVIFITEDDSQDGWDHISAYRTTAMVLSPYSRLKKTIRTQYNQTSLLRTIEQILGLPPLTKLDATALPMHDCFTDHKDNLYVFTHIPNRIQLNQMNKHFSQLKGKALMYAKLSLQKHLNKIDNGDDRIFNKILWFDAKNK